MQARITITGGQAKGYTVELKLPVEFCRQFEQEQQITVMQDYLREYWGNSEPGTNGNASGLRYKQWTVTTLDEAENDIEKIKGQIETAKHVLTETIDREILIDL